MKQRITYEPFEMVIYIRFAWKLVQSRRFKSQGIRVNVTLGGIRCSKGTPIIKSPTPPFLSKEEQRKKKKIKSLDTEQIYGHGSQRGSMPRVTVLAGCRQ
jgi:hypothetical protein